MGSLGMVPQYSMNYTYTTQRTTHRIGSPLHQVGWVGCDPSDRMKWLDVELEPLSAVARILEYLREVLARGLANLAVIIVILFLVIG